MKCTLCIATLIDFLRRCYTFFSTAPFSALLCPCSIPYMKKRVLFTMLLTSLLAITFAQDNFSVIKGKVMDSATQKPLAFVSVTLLGKKTKFILKAVTDSTGHYSFTKAPPGYYTLQFSLEGYVLFESPSFVKDSTAMILPDYLLRTGYRDLGTVTVRSVRPLITNRIDGFVYNAKNDVVMAGEKASDLIRKLPGVMVDPEGNPSMSGSSRIKVFIDGRPSAMFAASVAEALKQIPAENISSIEIITHPSAKYEAEGVDSVINIETKRPSQNAASGTINSTIANTFFDLNGNILTKRNKWIIGADAGHHSNNINVAVNTTRQGLKTFLNERLAQHKLSDIHRNSGYGGVNINFLHDTLTSVSFSFRSAWFLDNFDHTTDNILQSGSFIDSFTRISNSLPARWTQSMSVGYIKKSSDKKAELNLLAGGFRQPSNNDYDLYEMNSNKETYRESNTNRIANSEFSFQADYTKEMKHKSKLETGAKISFRDFSNNSDLFVFNYFTKKYLPDNARSADFGIKWAIPALYASYGFAIGDYKLRTGIRFEHTNFNLAVNNQPVNIPKYGSWLPNLLISKTFGAHTFTAGYTRRLQRPYIVYLNPLVTYQDSLNIERGNPLLKPVIIHNYSVAYTSVKNKWFINASVFLNRSVDNIEYVKTIKPGGGSESGWQNISNNSVYGAIFNLSYQEKKFHLT
jgi:hypothetical protein